MAKVTDPAELERRRALHAERMRGWRKSNPDATRDINRRAREKRQREVPEKVKAQCRRSAAKAYEKNPQKFKDKERLRRVKHWANTLLRTARMTSKSRGHGDPSVNVADIEALWVKQQGCCYWTGLALSKGIGSPYRVSLDRIDNARGYEPGNVVLVCWWINRARSDMSHDDFADLLHVFRETILRRARRLG